MALVNKSRGNSPISAETMTLREFFDNYRNLNMPGFQRPYSWGKKEIAKFLDPISQMLDDYISGENPKNLNYIGEIFISDLDSNSNLNKNIVDGQQRIITSLVFLIAIYWRLQSLLSNLDQIIPANDRRNISSLMNDALSDIQKIVVGSENTFRVKLSNNNDATFIEKILPNSTAGLDPLNNVIDNKNLSSSRIQLVKMFKYVYFDLFVSSYNNYLSINGKQNSFRDAVIKRAWTIISDSKELSDDDETLLMIRSCLSQIEYFYKLKNAILDGTFFSVVSSCDSESAFVIFETLNSTGKDLKPWDLVKGKVSSLLSNDTGNSTLKSQFENVAEDNEKKLGQNINNKILGYYLNYVYQEEVSPNSFYDKFVLLVDNDYKGAIIGLVNCLEFFNDFLREKNSWIKLFLDLIDNQNLFSVFYGLSKISDIHSDNSQGFITDLVLMIFTEKYVLQMSDKIINNQLKEVMVYLNKKGFNITNLSNIISLPSNSNCYEFWKLIGNKDVLDKIYNYESLDQKVNTLILYVLLRDESKNFAPIRINLNVEHAIPQTPSQEAISKYVDENPEWAKWDTKRRWKNNPYIKKIGNLYIMDKLKNIDLSNKDMNNKAEASAEWEATKKASDVLLNIDENVPDYKNMNQEFINKRTKKIMKKMADKISATFEGEK